MMNPVIALDIGGVCIQLHHDRYFAQLGIRSFEELPAPFLQACVELETGKLNNQEWFELCRRHLPGTTNLTDKELAAVFNTAIGIDIPGMAAAARRWVEAGYRLVFFSNTSEMHALEVCRNLSFAPLITGAVYSYEAGYMKPAPEIYQIFEEKFGRPHAYFDDRAENIEAARQLGWNAHLFTGAEEAERVVSMRVM